MPAKHGTLNVIDNSVFQVLSVPVNALHGFDDDRLWFWRPYADALSLAHSPGHSRVRCDVSPDGATVFATAPSGTAAFNAATGATSWTASAGAGLVGTSLGVSPDSSTVFAAGSSGVVAYNAATGAARWKDSLGFPLASQQVG